MSACAYGSFDALRQRPASTGTWNKHRVVAVAAAAACICVVSALISGHTTAPSSLIELLPFSFLAGKVLSRPVTSLATYWVNPYNMDNYEGVGNLREGFNTESYAAINAFNAEQYQDMNGYNGASFSSNTDYNKGMFTNNQEFDAGALSSNNAYNKGVYTNNKDFNSGAYDASAILNKKRGSKKGKKADEKKDKKKAHSVQVAKHQQTLASHDGWLDYNPRSSYWDYDHLLNKNPTGGQPVRIAVEHDPHGGADNIGSLQAPFQPKKIDIKVPESFQIEEYPSSVSGTHFK